MVTDIQVKLIKEGQVQMWRRIDLKAEARHLMG
jgi:hypothetical protein